MRHCHPLAPRSSSGSARGYTLIELMIAMAIALFLLGGLLTIVQSTRTTYRDQTALAGLQNSESLAMIMMTDVVQEGGYFPNPLLNTLATALPAAGAFQATQAITGTSGGAAPGDTFSVRYMTVSGDTIMNCLGLTNLAGPNVTQTYINTFSVDAAGNLDCTLSTNGVAAAPVPLVSGVQNLQIWYGVSTNPATGDNNVTAYLTAAQMNATPSYWLDVTAVKLRITFVNPLAAEQAGTPTTHYIERVVGVMSRTGVTT